MLDFLQKPLTKLFGTRFQREVKKVQPIVDAIKRHEAVFKDYSEEQLKAQTARFRGIIAERTGALKRELDEVRQLRHDCADPVERDKLEERFNDL
jgi:preprotein translocase subunit SecA